MQNVKINIADLEKLYSDAGWANYTSNLNKLSAAYEKSDFVASAWDDNQLVGVIRVISDGETIAYIQDILVLKDYQRMGIGSKLFEMALKKYKGVRQKVLLTDNAPKTVAFYESNGFEKCTDIGTMSFVRIDKSE